MRSVIVVDVESTGLGSDATILEVAAVNMTTGEEMQFVPRVPMEAFASASPMALKVNRYFERGIRAQMLTRENTGKKYYELRKWLDGNTLAGSNPTFDASLLRRAKTLDGGQYRAFGDSWTYGLFGDPWHHRLLDLSAYAAGVLRLPTNELPGLQVVCDMLGIENEDPHSALGDVRATVKCFQRLAEL